MLLQHMISYFSKEGFLSFLSTVMIIALPLNILKNQDKSKYLGLIVIGILLLLSTTNGSIDILGDIILVFKELLAALKIVFNEILRMISWPA